MKEMIKRIVFLVLVICAVISCKQDNKQQRHEQASKLTENANDTLKLTADNAKGQSSADTIAKQKTILILPCSNGYGSEVPIELFIENALKNNPFVKIIPFPSKKLQNIAYHGVFDKRYCTPIIDKVEVDYLIMSEISGERTNPVLITDTISRGYGYKIKILNTKTLEQKNSINAKDLQSLEDMQKDIMSK